MLTEKYNCLIVNKILGLKWGKFEDNFVFDFTEIREKFDVIPTKRNVIKAIASIYNPVGLNPTENKIEKNVPDINLDIINTKDVHAASNLWLRHIQGIFYSKKYDALKKNLNVFIDEHGIFRCRGRFANSSLQHERKYPILLPTDSHLTILVIRDAHKSVLHNGVRETINEIRRKYWIPRNDKR